MSTVRTPEEGTRVASMCTCVLMAALSLPSLANAAVLGLALILMWTALQPRLARPALAIPVGLLLFSIAVSILLSEQRDLSLRYTMSILPGVSLFLIVAMLFSGADIRMLFLTLSMEALLWSGALLSIAWNHPDLDPSGWTHECPSALFVTSNDLLFLVLVIPLSLALLFSRAGGVVRALASCSIVASLVTAVQFRSRGSVLSALMGVGIATAIIQRSLILPAAILSVSILLAVDALNGFTFVVRLEESWLTRVPPWLAALNMWRKAPIVGHGPRTYGLLFREYVSSLSISVGSWMPPRWMGWAHNLYLESLAEQGLFGLVSILFVIGAGISLGRDLCCHPGSTDRTLVAGAMTSLIVLAIAGTFEVTLVRLWVLVLLFVLLGSLAALAGERARLSGASRGEE